MRLFTTTRNMVFTTFLLFIIASNFTSVYAQTEDDASAKHGFFLEAGGTSPYYSLNFATRVFDGEKIKGYFRVGGSVWGDGVAFPVGLQFLTGKNGHLVELQMIAIPNSKGPRFWDRERSDLLLDLSAGIGYRYQPESGSFFIGTSIFPFLRLDPTGSELSEKKAEFKIRLGGSLGWFF